LKNLEWAPRSVNAADRAAHGCGRARSLTDEEAALIRELGTGRNGAKPWFTFKELARYYGVSARFVSNVVRGRTRSDAKLTLARFDPVSAQFEGAVFLPIPEWKAKRYGQGCQDQ